MQKKLSYLFLSFSLFSVSIIANDNYVLTYSKDANCTLTKNGKEIPLFDKRFDMKPPHNSYTCFTVQKEQYRECHIKNKKHVTALVFSYGPYEYTNLLVATQSPSKHIDNEIEVECSK